MEGDEEDVRSWSDAPGDILSLILSKLYAGDAAAFYAVCKRWGKVARVLVVERSLSDEELQTCPCLIFPNNRFFHPLYNTWFKMDAIPALPKGVILEQKYGWLLLRLRIDNNFFYNPFTGEQIDLPGYVTERVAFSAPPTSSNCEIVQFQLHEHNQIVAETFVRGEEDVISVDVCKSKSFFYLREYKTTFFQGRYYCLGKDGSLAIYDPKKSRQCGVTKAPTHLWSHFHTASCGRYLFEGEGDLWALFVALQGKEVCVLKLNLRNKQWKRVYDLEERMVFLSYQSCMMERSRVRGAGNKIYFTKFMGGNCLFYSMATKRYHTFEKGSSYDSFHGSQDMPHCTWIKMDTNPCLLKLASKT